MEDKKQSRRPGLDLEQERVRFDFIKANSFRVIHVDGVFGGLAPRGNFIHISVWNERWPLPKRTVHMLGPKGEMLEEIVSERVDRDAIVREVEADLIMDFECAKQLRDWLNEKIRLVESVMGSQSAKSPGEHQ